MKRVRSGIAVLLLGLTASAQTAAPPAAQPAARAAAAPLADYGKGFAKLYAMGLPHVGTGRYVRAYSPFGGSFEGFSHPGVSLQGNAWLLTPPSNGVARLVMDFAREVEAVEQRAFMKTWMKQAATNRLSRMDMPQHVNGRPLVQWQPVSLSNDLATALGVLEKDEGDSDVARVMGRMPAEMRAKFMEQQRRQRFEQSAGTFFLLAAHAYEQGYTNEANRIVRSLFTGLGDPRKAVLAAVGQMADAQYAGAMQRFQASSNDWAGLTRDLQGLLQRYAQGWPKRDAVAMLASNVQARATRGVPDVPGLSAADQALARRLATERPERSRGYEIRGWLLQPPSTNPPADVIAEITRRGFDGVKLLAALVDDPCLTAMDRNAMGYWSSYSSDDDAESRARRYYDQLPRPISRGEFACGLLKSVAPGGEERHSQEDNEPAAIREAALAFHRECAGKSREELARVYFQSGDSSQRQLAMRHLLKSKDPQTLAAIEAELSDLDKLDENLPALGEYARRQPEQAKVLIEKLLAELQPPPAAATNRAAAAAAAAKVKNEDADDADDEDADMFSGGRSRDVYRTRTLKQLLQSTGGGATTNLAALLDDVAEGKSMTRVWPALNSLAGRVSAQEVLTNILSRAVAATNVAARVNLLQMTTYIRYLDMQRRSELFDDEEDMLAAAREPQRPKPLDIAPVKALWTELLKDGRPIMGTEEGSSPRRLAATAIEDLHGVWTNQPGEVMAEEVEAGGDAAEDDEAAMMATLYADPSQWHRLFVMQGGEPAYDFMVQRAHARLSGTPQDRLPKPPAARDVKEPRRAELRRKLQDNPAPADLAGLALAERLWLAGEVRKNKPLNARLAPLSMHIATVDAPPELKTLSRDLAAALQGQSLNRTNTERMVSFLKGQLSAGRRLVITASRKPGMQGVEVGIWPTNQVYGGVNSVLLSYGGMQVSKAGVVGMLQGGAHCRAFWPLADVAKATNAPSAKAQAAAQAAALAADGEASEEMIELALSEMAVSGEGSEQQGPEALWKALEAAGNGTSPAAGDPLHLWLFGQPERTAKDVRRLMREMQAGEMMF